LSPFSLVFRLILLAYLVYLLIDKLA